MSWLSDATGIDVDVPEWSDYTTDVPGFSGQTGANGVTLNDVLTDANENLTPPKPPTPEDPAVKDAMDKEKRRKGGRAATLLTGGQGLLDDPMTAKRYLLGA
jgi:hypothetical protein